MMLPGAGCSWSKEKDGGCHMCGFKRETRKYTLNLLFPSFVFLKLFDEGYDLVKNKEPYLASIFNGGSFLNNKEIPLSTQTAICKRIKNIDSIKQLLIEARPEYITDEKIKTLTSCLGKKELIAGIGLECESDTIRKMNINKGFTCKDYEKAVNILKDNGAKVLTYVFLKPLNLTEREAIDEAVETARYAFSRGSDYVVYNAATVQKGTKMCEYYVKGKFRPPWLWSILEVAKQTHEMGATRVGDFTDEPRPIAGPQNCEKCTPALKKLFDEYKHTNDLSVFKDFHCECRQYWEKEVAKI